MQKFRQARLQKYQKPAIPLRKIRHPFLLFIHRGFSLSLISSKIVWSRHSQSKLCLYARLSLSLLPRSFTERIRGHPKPRLPIRDSLSVQALTDNKSYGILFYLPGPADSRLSRLWQIRPKGFRPRPKSQDPGRSSSRRRGLCTDARLENVHDPIPRHCRSRPYLRDYPGSHVRNQLLHLDCHRMHLRRSRPRLYGRNAVRAQRWQERTRTDRQVLRKRNEAIQPGPGHPADGHS